MIPFQTTFPFLFKAVNTYRSHTLRIRDRVKAKYESQRRTIWRKHAARVVKGHQEMKSITELAVANAGELNDPRSLFAATLSAHRRGQSDKRQKVLPVEPEARRDPPLTTAGEAKEEKGSPSLTTPSLVIKRGARPMFAHSSSLLLSEKPVATEFRFIASPPAVLSPFSVSRSALATSVAPLDDDSLPSAQHLEQAFKDEGFDTDSDDEDLFNVYMEPRPAAQVR